MKTVIRQDGRKFIVSNALYEEIQKKGILDEADGDAILRAQEAPYQAMFNKEKDGEGSKDNQESVKDTTGGDSNIKSIGKDKILNGEDSLELTPDLRHRNQIVGILRFLYTVYMNTVKSGNGNCPFCIVCRSDKFKNRFFNVWKRIARILEKDPSVRTDKEKEIINSFDLNGDIKQQMINHLHKIYKF